MRSIIRRHEALIPEARLCVDVCARTLSVLDRLAAGDVLCCAFASPPVMSQLRLPPTAAPQLSEGFTALAHGSDIVARLQQTTAVRLLQRIVAVHSTEGGAERAAAAASDASAQPMTVPLRVPCEVSFFSTNSSLPDERTDVSQGASSTLLPSADKNMWLEVPQLPSHHRIVIIAQRISRRRPLVSPLRLVSPGAKHSSGAGRGCSRAHQRVVVPDMDG
jgi:hypothetical protein